MMNMGNVGMWKWRNKKVEIMFVVELRRLSGTLSVVTLNKMPNLEFIIYDISFIAHVTVRTGL